MNSSGIDLAFIIAALTLPYPLALLLALALGSKNDGRHVMRTTN